MWSRKVTTFFKIKPTDSGLYPSPTVPSNNTTQLIWNWIWFRPRVKGWGEVLGWFWQKDRFSITGSIYEPSSQVILRGTRYIAVSTLIPLSKNTDKSLQKRDGQSKNHSFYTQYLYGSSHSTRATGHALETTQLEPKALSAVKAASAWKWLYTSIQCHPTKSPPPSPWHDAQLSPRTSFWMLSRILTTQLPTFRKNFSKKHPRCYNL
jgi:hypothetical protein